MEPSKNQPDWVVLCMGCQKARSKSGTWHRTEIKQLANPTIQVTHGLCPECGARLYPEFWPPKQFK